ncbi:D-alanyl-D-alanine carboxypeptidase family protein [Marinobacterium sediminicola]|uniref:serine-type D-Ala-D-Ala carboxypeptidase n=1 Tax=Marinobacterium sediminicola TaxID=518898 RepID=A0ABY1S0E7_9GAMM|nr:D-alanyl-D-alanine carboxypeptidase family protein [Marinobacterium sediminicola]ULG69629.1 D-alanyl-D-alanine carboxypeptidase [Marinobacterium sediminicola]SMR74643.1 D-alanyl-D-alanine carboxypeptidase (penicillin-binding protein 5/6) [Marinobacterium sediminicola]
MAQRISFSTAFLYLTLMLALLMASTVQAASALIPAPPQVSARAYLVMDADTGHIIAADRENERFAPASLTKMMTSYIVEYEISKGNISEEDLVLVSEKAWRTGGSRMFIQEGTQVKVGDLLRGVIIQSGNDASVALAEHIAGSERAFADLMNQHARLLGMNDTHFVNATGLPAEDHYSSAIDLAILAKALITKFPDQYAIYAQKYFTYNNIRQPNRNKLLWRDNSVDGIKTGHTDEAGYCLVASAKRDDMRLISVVMGTDSEEARARESQKLLSYGFRYYRTHQLYTAGQVLKDSKIWAGQRDQVRMGLTENLAVTVPRGKIDQLEANIELDKVIKAPVVQGQELGKVRVSIDGETVTTVPLVALESVEEGGLFKRIWHAILLFFLGLIG